MFFYGMESEGGCFHVADHVMIEMNDLVIYYLLEKYTSFLFDLLFSFCNAFFLLTFDFLTSTQRPQSISVHDR